MKFFRFLFFLLLFNLFFSQTAFAHSPGFPPFFRIEGEIAQTYFLEDAGVYTTELIIPQDVAHKEFLVNEEIEFEIDATMLESIFPLEVIESSEYTWDFGDGEKGEGLVNTHRYQRPGSYILTITADFQDASTPEQLIESVLIHIVPSEDYQLPKAVIRVNGQSGSKDNYNILEFDLNNDLEFDGSGSSSPDSRIVRYAWDFGDDKIAIGEKVSHQYELPQAFATILLRVTDANGLISDAIVNVRNVGSNEPKELSQSSLLSIILPAVLVVAIIVGGLSLFRRKKK